MVQFDVDSKYPQALGNIIQRLSIFGNSPWEILLNDNPDSPYFTSDFPVAIEARGRTGIVNRIVPLTPTIALRVIPDIELSRAEPDLSFSRFRYRRRIPGHSEILELNRLIVRCAEELVFYRDNLPWIESFIRKNRLYRIEAVTSRIPYERGFMNVATQRVLKRRDVV
jgi:hypothetical protein